MMSPMIILLKITVSSAVLVLSLLFSFPWCLSLPKRMFDALIFKNTYYLFIPTRM